ncbi:uncharacterized protein [Spinacia oleracea]|uniref:RNase H type-1 domain-containing protein n=1 Tax=Spinacia oleracea TaxID=3562 RepID=A0ABM3R4A6_SPIOL|nr:uncharacterized protein LOC130465632 [Spinacia oleracea]
MSSKSIYACLLRENNEDHCDYSSSKFYKLLWHSCLLPKWKIFVWKLINKALPLRPRMIRRGIMVDDKCPFCCKDVETEDHLFRDCEIVQRVWCASSLGIKINGAAHIRCGDWVKNFLAYLWKGNKDGRHDDIEFAAVLWAIWVTRNNLVFRGGEVDPTGVMWIIENQKSMAWAAIDGIKKGIRNGGDVAQEGSSSKTDGVLIKESINDCNIHMQVDGAWKKVRRKFDPEAAIGWVIERNGSVIAEDASPIRCNSALKAEVLALLDGIQQAKNRGWWDLHIMTDSAILVAALRSFPNSPFEIAAECADIIRISLGMRNVYIKKCSRNRVRRAHYLATMARKNGS